MRSIFVDSNYLVALTNPRDQWRARARKIQLDLGTVTLVTTEFVLVELLNYFAETRSDLRAAAVNIVHKLRDNPAIEIVPCTHVAFESALELYSTRSDKGYSLTDCVSMNVIRERGISDVLTHDNHFTQEGFKVLL